MAVGEIFGADKLSFRFLSIIQSVWIKAVPNYSKMFCGYAAGIEVILKLYL
jgi:hypothetical protein